MTPYALPRGAATSGTRTFYISSDEFTNDSFQNMVEVNFNWKVESQNGMESKITWDIKVRNGASQSEPHTKLYCTIGDNTYTWNLSTAEYTVDSLGWRIIQLYGHTATTGDGQDYVHITRDSLTNVGELNVNVSWDEGYVTFPTLYNINAHFPAVSNDFTCLVATTTTHGSGVRITSIDWENDEANPVIHYVYDKGTNVTGASAALTLQFPGHSYMNPNVSSTHYLNININYYTMVLTEDEHKKLWPLLQDGDTGSVTFQVSTTEYLSDGTSSWATNTFDKTFKFINHTPLITPEIVDINPATIALTSDPSKLIKYMSHASYKINAELRKGGLEIIGSYIQNGGKIEEGFLEGVFENPTSNTFYFSATDDRGYTGTAMYSLSSFDGEFIEYIKPTVIVQCSSISGTGFLTVNIKGKYFPYSFSENTPNQFKIYYAAYPIGEPATDWVDIGEAELNEVDSSTYSYTFTISGLDYTKQYNIAVKFEDRLMSAEAATTAVSYPIFYWNGTRFDFNIPVYINDAIVDTVVEEKSVSGYYMNSNGSYTSGGYNWNYKKWASGLLECWCSIPITTTITTSWGNMYVAATQYKTDLSYPVQLIETPSITVTLGAGATRGILIADNSYAADTISTGKYNIASPVAITSNATFRINYYVRGKWK